MSLLAEARDRGNDAFKAGDFPRAVEEYSEAIKRDPTSVAAYTNRATARTKLMDFGPALEDCNKAIKLDPANTKAYNRRAAIEFLLKVRCSLQFLRTTSVFTRSTTFSGIP